MTGFIYKGVRVYYIEALGEDETFNRRRIELYYSPNYARTVLFETEEGYEKFLEIHKEEVYDTYTRFKEDWEAGKLEQIHIEARCPFCKTSADAVDNWVPILQVIETGIERWQVVCANCKAHGPEAKDKDLAIIAWNRGGMDDTGTTI